jgi:nicotinamide mononucleotide adenylyltransferase
VNGETNNNLVRRLRLEARQKGHELSTYRDSLWHEAADRIEELETQMERQK